MANITDNFLFLRFDSSVTRVNRHHNNGGTFAITELFNSGTFSSSTYQVFCDPSQKQLCHVDGLWYDFAFISVTNAKDGSEIIFASDMPPTHIKSIPIGTGDMVVTRVYGKIPSTVGGQPAIWVDAFDAETGLFSDENFVEIDDAVTHAKNVTETDHANTWGYVSTVKAEILNAYSTIDANIPFKDWSDAHNSALYTNNHLVNAGITSIFIVSIFQKPKGIICLKLVCKPLTICKPLHLCPDMLVARCNASLRPGCMAESIIDWDPGEIYEINQIFDKFNVNTIADVAKLDLSKVEKELAITLPASKAKSLMMMLKQIQKENG